MKRVVKIIGVVVVFCFFMASFFAEVGCLTKRKEGKEIPLRVKIDKIKRNPLKYEGRRLC